MEQGKKATPTTRYGWIQSDSKHFNDMDFFGDENLHYVVTKIKIWTGKKEGKKVVVGVQFFYKSYPDGKEEITPGPHIGTLTPVKEYEHSLKEGEYIRKFFIRTDNEVTEIGFETTKGHKFIKGGGHGEEKTIPINDQDQIIFALFGCTGETLQGCGAYSLDRKEYFKEIGVPH